MSGGILERGDIVRGDFVLGGYCPGGYCPGGYCPDTIYIRGDIYPDTIYIYILVMAWIRPGVCVQPAISHEAGGRVQCYLPGRIPFLQRG